MLSGLAAAGVGALTSAFSSIGSGYRARKQARYENKLAQENMYLQDAINDENWRVQQEYNTPARQLERLQEAGMNPNLAYGNGQISGNTANSAADGGTPQGPHVDNPDFTGAFTEAGRQIGTIASNYMQYKAINADIRQKAVQNSLIEAQTKVALQQERDLVAEALRKAEKHPVDMDILRKRSKELDHTIALMDQQFQHNIENQRLKMRADDREERRLSFEKRRSDALAALEQFKLNYYRKNGHEIPRDGKNDMYSQLWNVVKPYLTGEQSFEFRPFFHAWLAEKGLRFLIPKND